MPGDDYLTATREANAAFREISQYTSELNNVNELILDDEVRINNDITNIKNETVYSPENSGLASAKVGSSADGVNDEDFFIPYYDENGDCYFLINQFNPLIGNLFAFDGKHAFREGGCGPSSYANAFIMGYGVHSLVDSIGILGAFLYLSKGGGVDGNKLIDACTSPGGYTGAVDKRQGSLSYLYKYMYDEEGNPKCIKTTNKEFLKIIASPDFEGGSYALKYPLDKEHSKEFDTWVADLESQGYEVDISIGGMSFGQSNSMFGSTKDSGHYGGVYYNTDNGLNIMDSYGARTFRYERENMGLEDGLGWSSNNGFNENGVRNATGTKTVYNKRTATEDTFWHENSVMIGTSYNFKDMQEQSGISGCGACFITIKKKD